MGRIRFIAGCKGARIPASTVNTGPGDNYGLLFGTGTDRASLAKLLEWWWRVKTWSYEIDLTRNPAGTTSSSGTLTAIPEVDGPALTGERERLRRAGWEFGLFVPPSELFAYSVTFRLFNGASNSSKIGSDGPELTNYDAFVYAQIVTQWGWGDVDLKLETVTFGPGFAFGSTSAFRAVLKVGPVGSEIILPLGYSVVYTDMYGMPTTPDPDFVSWDITLAIRPTAWLPYKNQLDQAIYDEATGNQLITPFQPGDPV